jgi:hypothetical protein
MPLQAGDRIDGVPHDRTPLRRMPLGRENR